MRLLDEVNQIANLNLAMLAFTRYYSPATDRVHLLPLPAGMTGSFQLAFFVASSDDAAFLQSCAKCIAEHRPALPAIPCRYTGPFGKTRVRPPASVPVPSRPIISAAWPVAQQTSWCSWGGLPTPREPKGHRRMYGPAALFDGGPGNAEHSTTRPNRCQSAGLASKGLLHRSRNCRLIVASNWAVAQRNWPAECPPSPYPPSARLFDRQALIFDCHLP